MNNGRILKVLKGNLTGWKLKSAVITVIALGALAEQSVDINDVFLTKAVLEI